MTIEGGCYCGSLRYETEGEPAFKGQCHCRECQYIAGGSPNMIIGLLGTGFSYVKGSPKVFKRTDIENAVSREFCADCGTHILARPPGMPLVMVKVGTMDDPSLYGGPQVAIYCIDKQEFHRIPEGIPKFERLPG